MKGSVFCVCVSVCVCLVTAGKCVLYEGYYGVCLMRGTMGCVL